MKENPTFRIFEAAYGRYAVAAFNVFSAEQVQGVFTGACQARAPILVAVTPAARRYLRPALIEGLIRGAAEAFPEVVFSVHLDHGTAEECRDAIDSGFYSSVMIDASHEEFERNIEITREVVARARDKGVFVEAELGVLSGLEDDLSIAEEKARYTDPRMAAEFVESTGCNSLAVAIGTSHGAYKFSGQGKLKFDILKRIQEQLPTRFPLVLHGASEVPRSEVERINAAGGKLKVSASGVPASRVREAIRMGVCKINIATDMRLIWTRCHREFFLEEPERFDLMVPGRAHMEALSEFVRKKCDMLGASGKAERMTTE